MLHYFYGNRIGSLELANLVNNYGWLLIRDHADQIDYYNGDKVLQFSFVISKNRYYDAFGNKLYNNEFKRLIKNLSKRLDDLIGFW
jgi:hypothetical protein